MESLNHQLVTNGTDIQGGGLCNGVPPLHGILHTLIIKYEYHVKTDIIFSQYYLSRQYCDVKVIHWSLVSIGQ